MSKEKKKSFYLAKTPLKLPQREELQKLSKDELIDKFLEVETKYQNTTNLDREELERQGNKLSIRIEIPVKLDNEEDISDETKKELATMLANRMSQAITFVGF